MDRNNDQISQNQMYSLLVTLIIGIGILSLPRALADKAGPDSLIVIIAGSILFFCLAILINKLIAKFPNSSIIEIGSLLMGRPIGQLLGFLYIIYLFVLMVLQTRAFGEIVKSFLLLATPIEVIMISLLLSCTYLVRSGIEPIARIAVIIFPLSLIPMILTMFAIINEVDPTYFLPILRTPMMDLIKSLPEIMFSFLGYEFILFLGYFVKEPTKIKKESYWALFTVSIIYFITVFIVIGRFGILGTKNLIWPTITLFKTIEFPGTIIENVEVVILSTWLLSIFATISITFFGLAFLTSKVVNAKDHNYFVLPYIPLIYAIALMPENIAEVYEWMGVYTNVLGTIFAIIVPVALLVISLFRNPKRGARRNAQ